MVSIRQNEKYFCLWVGALYSINMHYLRLNTSTYKCLCRSHYRVTILFLSAGYWWTVVTMTTVGYGDYYPRTWLGYIVAVVIMIAGLMFTSLPIAIVGGNFAAYHSYNRKREMRQWISVFNIKTLKNVVVATVNTLDAQIFRRFHVRSQRWLFYMQRYSHERYLLFLFGA